MVSRLLKVAALGMLLAACSVPTEPLFCETHELVVEFSGWDGNKLDQLKSDGFIPPEASCEVTRVYEVLVPLSFSFSGIIIAVTMTEHTCTWETCS